MGVNSTDSLFIKVDQAITVNNCTTTTCSTCACSITARNPSAGLLYNTIKISNFPFAALTTDFSYSITVLLGIKNPISSGYVLSIATTDSQNYTKEISTASFPNIVESTISQEIFSLAKSIDIVYSNTNFTLTLNFLNYSLINGWMIIEFDPNIVLLDPSNPYCLSNGNNNCITSTSNGYIRLNITVSQSITVYIVNINNLRNPNSTKFFNFKVKLTNIDGLVYYTLTSPSYQASKPYQLTPTVNSSSCLNSQSTIVTINFPFLPFTPLQAVTVDDSSASAFNG